MLAEFPNYWAGIFILWFDFLSPIPLNSNKPRLTTSYHFEQSSIKFQNWSANKNKFSTFMLQTVIPTAYFLHWKISKFPSFQIQHKQTSFPIQLNYSWFDVIYVTGYRVTWGTDTHNHLNAISWSAISISSSDSLGLCQWPFLLH